MPQIRLECDQVNIETNNNHCDMEDDTPAHGQRVHLPSDLEAKVSEDGSKHSSSPQQDITQPNDVELTTVPSLALSNGLHDPIALTGAAPEGGWAAWMAGM